LKVGLALYPDKCSKELLYAKFISLRDDNTTFIMIK